MAKKRVGRKMSRVPRVEEAELILNFALTETGTHYISIPAVLSILNRKLFRAARDYAVSGISLYSLTSGSKPNAKITTLSNNWPTKNAIVKAYHLWTEMNQKVLDDNPSLQGRWADFKPGFDSEHTVQWVANGIGTMKPVDSAGNLYATPNEWDQAQITLPQHEVNPGTGVPIAAVNRFLHVLGADDLGSDSLGIIQGYQETRATVQLSDPADDLLNPSNWMITLFDEGSSDPELAGQIADENDQPPYDRVQYPGAVTNGIGGQVQGYLACNFDVATGATKTQDVLPGFICPLGLIKLETTDITGTEFLQIRVAPGMYKGCASMSVV